MNSGYMKAIRQGTYRAGYAAGYAKAVRDMQGGHLLARLVKQMIKLAEWSTDETHKARPDIGKEREQSE